MKNKIQKSGATSAELQTGQVWRLNDSFLRIDVVGKRLVHYKLYKGQVPNPAPLLLSGRGAVEELLRKHRAVLLETPPAAGQAGGARRPKAAAKKLRA
jgi:hypothetical protein